MRSPTDLCPRLSPMPPVFPGPHRLSPGCPSRGRGWHGGTGDTRGDKHGGNRGTRRGAGIASGQGGAGEGSGRGRGGRLPAPTGLGTGPQPPRRAARRKARRGGCPRPCRAAGLFHLLPSERCREQRRGAAGRSPSPGGEDSRRPRVGPPPPLRDAHQGHGWDAEGYVAQPNPAARPNRWIAWDFLGRCGWGGGVMGMGTGTSPNVSQLAGVCASSC